MQPEMEEPDIDAGGTLSESSTPDTTLSEEIPVRRVTGSNAPYSGRSDPLTLAVRDFLALTRQVLPEPTYTHLKNAGREAVLAVVTLFESMNSAVGPVSGKQQVASSKQKADGGKQ
jgi:hypothetical protein